MKSCWVLILFLTFFVLDARADLSLADAKKRVAEVVEKLNRFQRDRAGLEYLPKSYRNDVIAAYQEMTALVEEIVDADIPSAEEKKLFESLFTTSAGALELLTGDYAVVEEMETLLAGEREDLGRLAQITRGAGNVIKFIGAGIWRDLKSLVYAKNEQGEWAFPSAWGVGLRLPFTSPSVGLDLGVDTRRSTMLRKIGSILKSGIQSAVEKLDGDEEEEYLQRMNEALGKFKDTEPYQYGPTNIMMKLIYKGFIVWQFAYKPFLDVCWERTEFSGLYSAIFIGGVFTALDVARTRNSGIAFYSAVKNLSSICDRAVSGRRNARTSK